MKESFGLYWPSVMKFQPTSTFSQTQAPASLCLHSPHCFVFMFLFHFTEVYLYLKAVHSFAFLFMFYMLLLCMCSSNQISCSVASDSLRPHESQHSRPPCAISTSLRWYLSVVWLCISLAIVDGRRQWHPTLVLLPGKSHGRRSLVGCSPRGCEESDTTE